MGTTIRLNDALLAEAKSYAAEIGITFTALVEESLRHRLAANRLARRGRVQLLTTGEGGLQPGVDLDDSASVLDAMDGPQPFRGVKWETSSEYVGDELAAAHVGIHLSSDGS